MSNEIKLANATIKVWRIKKSMNCYAENSQAEMTVQLTATQTQIPKANNVDLRNDSLDFLKRVIILNNFNQTTHFIHKLKLNNEIISSFIKAQY